MSTPVVLFAAGASASSRDYVVAVALALGGVISRLTLGLVAGGGTPFLFAYPAVLAAAALGGWGPGALATGLSVVAAGTVLRAPSQDLSAGDVLVAAVFAISGLGISAVAQRLRDVMSEARTIAEEHARTARRTRLVMDAVPALISYIDHEGRYTLVNEEYERWFGVRCEEVQGRLVRDVLGARAWAAIGGHLRRALDGETVRFEQELPYAAGPRCVSVTYAPDRGADGVIHGVVALVQDIGERTRAEAALQAAADRTSRLQRITAAVSAAIDLAEVGGVIVGHGRTTLGADGVAFALVVGDALEIVAGDGMAFVRWGQGARVPVDGDSLMADAARSRAPRFLAAANGGAGCPMLASALASGPAGAMACVPLLAGGNLVGVVTLAWTAACPLGEGAPDLLLAVGQQCAQAVERVRLYAAEQDARRAAEASNEAKDRFLAILSHELRTPLTPVLVAAQLLLRRSTPPERVAELAAMIARNARLEARLIDDLLDLTRISRGKLVLGFELVDVHRQLDEVVATCAADIEAKRLRLEVRAYASRTTLQADVARLQQVLWNLLKNAVKFSHPGGCVRVSTHDAGPWLEIVVEDEGIGMDPVQIPRLFDAFEQGAQEVTRTFGGLGLGLAIAKALVEAHGGQIRASSEGVGRGARFTVQLPTVELIATPPPPEREGRTAAARGRVLLVDDHDDTLSSVGELLRSVGYEVRGARDVASGLALVRAESFDVLISDLGLPDGFGTDLLAHVRVASPTLPAIALSGFGMNADVERARAAGFLDHLTKPVDPQRLLAVVAAALESAPPREVDQALLA